MDAEHFRMLFDYSYWARDRLMRAVEALSEEEYMATRPMDYGSVHGTLAHILAADLTWLSRWQGEPPERQLGGSDFADLATLQQRWREHEPSLRAYVASADDEALNAQVHYRGGDGQPGQRALWELMIHLINHGTNHRSEVATVVTQLGHSPGGLDLLVYLNDPGR